MNYSRSLNVLALALVPLALAACQPKALVNKRSAAKLGASGDALPNVDEVGNNSDLSTESDVVIAGTDTTTVTTDTVVPTTTVTATATVTSTKAYVYAANTTGVEINRFVVDYGTKKLNTSGSLSASDGRKTPSIVALSDAVHLIASQSGSFKGLQAFDVDAATGNLAVKSSVETDGVEASFIVLNTDESYIYGADPVGGNLSVCKRATDGALSFVQKVAAGTNPQSILIHPSGTILYVPNSGSDDISLFSVSATDGKLTPLGKKTMAAKFAPRMMRFHPIDATLAVVIGESGNVATMRVAADGTLTDLKSLSIGTQGGDVLFTKSGARLYATARGENSVVWVDITTATGEMAVKGQLAVGGQPISLALVPDDSMLLVGNSGTNTVGSFTIDSATGALTAGDAQASNGPTSLALIPAPN